MRYIEAQDLSKQHYLRYCRKGDIEGLWEAEKFYALCHYSLGQVMRRVHAKSLQLDLTLCDPMDCNSDDHYMYYCEQNSLEEMDKSNSDDHYIYYCG